MNREWLLDTNIATAFLAGNEQVRRRFSTRLPHRLPFVTVAELLYGAERARDPGRARAALAEFLSLFEILGTSTRTPSIYAHVRGALANAGRSIPANDLWIVSLALEAEATVVTDDAHFDRIPELGVENWLAP